jgi:hypothetical protein
MSSCSQRGFAFKFIEPRNRRRKRSFQARASLIHADPHGVIANALAAIVLSR